ncbi:hypothetical protein SH139x_000813 [Planctomycetaceae bacterium SH139]
MPIFEIVNSSNQHRCIRVVVTCLFLGGLSVLVPGKLTATEPLIRFDAAAAVAAIPADTPAATSITRNVTGQQTPAEQAAMQQVSAQQLDGNIPLLSGNNRLWLIPLELSTLIVSPTAPRVDQVLIEAQLLDESLRVADYGPRTQTASRFVGDISVELCDESNQRVGLSAAGSYPPLAKADLGADVGSKQSELRKYQEVAPLEILAAAGTTSRHRGVFFKLRATPQQVLEGDKLFYLVVSAPADWRAGLLSLRMRAQSTRRSLPGMPPEPVLLADRQFLIAVHRHDDAAARLAANEFRSALERLQAVAQREAKQIERRAQSNLLHQLATKLELAEPKIPADWLQQTIFHRVDTHSDRRFQRLPVDVRVAVLDYQAARQAFLSNAAEPVENLVSTQLAEPPTK